MTTDLSVHGQLANVALFDRVPRPLLEPVVEAASERSFSAGEQIFAEGAHGTSLYIVVEGRVRIEVVASSGRAFLLGTMTAGDVFGDLAVFDEGPRSADAVALDDTRCLLIPRAAVLRVAQSDPQLLDAVIRSFGALARRLTERLTQFALLDAAGRLAAVLLDVAAEAADDKGPTVALNQSDLARMIGASRQTTNRALREFESRGYVRLAEGSVTVRDRPALQRRARP